MTEKNQNKKASNIKKQEPIRIVIEPVYIGDKKISDAFRDLIYNDILAKMI